MGLLDNLFATPNDQGMWAASTGLFGVRRGNEGAALMNAMNVYNQAQETQRRQQLADLQRKQIEAALSDREQEANWWKNPANLMGPQGPLPQPDVVRNMVGSGVPAIARQGFGAMQKEVRPPVVVGKGGVLVDPATGRPLFQNQEQRDQWEIAPDVRLPSGQLVMRNKATGEIKAVGSGPLVQNTVNSGQPKPPEGYRWRPDGSSVEPIPGGPKDTSEKDEAARQQTLGKINTVIRKVDEALAKVGPFTTGMPGSIFGNIKGTSAYDLRKTAVTIKANIGFNELQEMRKNSPTGGALGQVAVQELESLQAVLANLDPDQSEDVIHQNLQQVKEHYEAWRNAVEQSGKKGAQRGPAPGTVEGGYVFRGGDPGDPKNWTKQ